MKEKIVSYSIVAILGIIIGLLIYRPLFIEDVIPVPIVIDSTSMTGVPDTVYIDTTYYIDKWHTSYRDTGRVDTIEVPRSPIGLRVVPVFSKRHQKSFTHSDHVKSKVFVWTPMTAQVDSIRSIVVVDFPKYVELNIVPVHEKELYSAKSNFLIKGLVSGGLVGFALSTGNPWVIGGSVLAGSGIVIFF